MIKQEENIYYQKIARCSVKSLIAILVVTLTIFVIEVVVLYLKFIPLVLEPIEQLLPTSMTDMLEESFGMIIVALGVWAVLFFIMNIALIITCRNTKKFLNTADGKTEGSK